MRVATADARSRQPVAPAALFIALGLAFLGGLGSTIYTAYLDHDYSSRRAAYDAAQPCVGSSDITKCRYVGDAQVVGKTMPAQDPRVEIKFTQLAGLDVTAYLDRTHTDEWKTWLVGSVLRAELWQGSVTLVAGVETLDNPHNLPEVGPIPTLAFGALTVACAVGIAFYLLLNLRSRRERPSG